jgi:hypothetical protein
MNNQNHRCWEVKDSPISGWRTLPGMFSAREIWTMRQRGDFWIAMPVGEDALASKPSL